MSQDMRKFSVQRRDFLTNIDWVRIQLATINGNEFSSLNLTCAAFMGLLY